MTMQAIETAYKGYRFRSRLEARWAVFFDALGYEWQYEPQGFEKLTDHDDPVRYLPDFFLPRTDTWVEVKGSDVLWRADADRLEKFLDYGSPLPGFTNSLLESAPGQVPGLLVLGEIPDPDRFGLYLHTLVQHCRGLVLRWAWFQTHRLCVADEGAETMIHVFGGLEPKRGLTWNDVSTRADHLPTRLHLRRVTDAYRAARSARFEHGDCG